MVRDKTQQKIAKTEIVKIVRSKLFFGIAVFIILALIPCLMYYFLFYVTSDQSPTLPKKDSHSVRDVDNMRSAGAAVRKQLLAENDYDSYQGAMYDIYDKYNVIGEYDKARSALDDIEQTVPEESLWVSIYEARSILEKNHGKPSEYKKYTEKLIERLEATGSNSEAQLYKEQLYKVNE